MIRIIINDTYKSVPSQKCIDGVEADHHQWRSEGSKALLNTSDRERWAIEGLNLELLISFRNTVTS